MDYYGVIGSGNFGTAMANVMALNGKVLIYVRRQEVYDNILHKRFNRGQTMHANVQPTMSLEEVANKCKLIVPLVPSSNFREMIQKAAPFLTPEHILVHGTKGLDIQLPTNPTTEKAIPLRREYIHTMCDIIQQESVVIRVGCLSGPNLSKEIANNEPTATVVASRFDEVIEQGKQALKGSMFRVYGSHDVLGIELAGVLKNIMAIGAGMLRGLNFGENSKAMLISRGLGEMIKLGKALGADTSAFLGVAGVGDLVATCSSQLSRNHTVGYRLAKGENLDTIVEDMNQVVEGIKTVKIAKGISMFYHLELPIVEGLYRVLYEGDSISNCMNYLMSHGFDKDVDFY
ncbi:MAG: NAD(P)H-dependent glycerol-3-phosphate dehydrogenase [Chitinophagales bacterium]